ncbi:MAG: hypothetical protein KIT73_04620 [Burkholderiales bacterium]|nr:hypothetical protein [Burkholderiales bacterium]
MDTAMPLAYPRARVWQGFADDFDAILELVLHEAFPSLDPLTDAQAAEAATLANEAWTQYCITGGNRGAMLRWMRERVAAPAGRATP